MGRILIADDHDALRRGLVRALTEAGHEVDEAANGNAALERLHDGYYDVVLSDLGLPDIPGDVLIRQILAGGRGHPRVVVVTGYGEPYLTRARQAGAEVVFTKPVEWSRILEWLERPDLAASA